MRFSRRNITVLPNEEFLPYCGPSDSRNSYSTWENLLITSEGEEFVLPTIPPQYREIGPRYIKEDPMNFQIALYVFLWPLAVETPRIQCDIVLFERGAKYPIKLLHDVNFVGKWHFTEKGFVCS